jgi:hypothetical protein
MRVKSLNVTVLAQHTASARSVEAMESWRAVTAVRTVMDTGGTSEPGLHLRRSLARAPRTARARLSGEGQRLDGLPELLDVRRARSRMRAALPVLSRPGSRREVLRPVH